MANSKLKKISLSGALSVTITIIFVYAYQVYLNVEIVNKYFSPKITSVQSYEKNTDEWNRIKFGDQDYVKFDSLFWGKKIVNSANSTGNVLSLFSKWFA